MVLGARGAQPFGHILLWHTLLLRQKDVPIADATGKLRLRAPLGEIRPAFKLK
jgi:hypothetical protein